MSLFLIRVIRHERCVLVSRGQHIRVLSRHEKSRSISSVPFSLPMIKRVIFISRPSELSLGRSQLIITQE